MKPTVALFAAFLFFVSCSKEKNETPFEQSFAVNESLIDTTSIIYFVADVEGLEPTTKLLHQDAQEECTAATAEPFSSEPYAYGSVITDDIYNYTYKFLVFNRKENCAVTQCPLEEVLPLSDATLLAPNQTGGSGFYFLYVDAATQRVYSSLNIDNTTLSESSVKIMRVNDSAYCDVHADYELYEVKLYFNVTLKSGDGKILKFKNAISKSVMAI